MAGINHWQVSDGRSDGEGSVLTSNISQEDKAMESEDDDDGPSVPAMFKGAELYFQASGLAARDFFPPDHRDEPSVCA